MKKVVQQKQVVVAQAKQDCEELLVEIVQDKRVADEQEKQVCIQSNPLISAAAVLLWARCCVAVQQHKVAVASAASGTVP
jgi:dynein heavy chain